MTGLRRRPGGATSDRGSATVELALTVPAVVLLLFLGVTVVKAAGLKMACIAAARDAALAEARGDSGQSAGQRVAPAGAAITVRVEGGLARAVVSVRVPMLGGRLAPTVSAEAVAAVEPGAP